MFKHIYWFRSKLVLISISRMGLNTFHGSWLEGKPLYNTYFKDFTPSCRLFCNHLYQFIFVYIWDIAQWHMLFNNFTFTPEHTHRARVRPGKARKSRPTIDARKPPANRYWTAPERVLIRTAEQPNVQQAEAPLNMLPTLPPSEQKQILFKRTRADANREGAVGSVWVLFSFSESKYN